MLERIILHWTAGADGVIEMERAAYHFIIGRDGKVTAGLYAPEANIDCTDGEYAKGAKGINTGSIHVAVDAMAGAKERPFDPGKWPLTWPQIHAMARLVADLCLRYRIELTGRTVLTHAEVQPVLGKPQSQKWDITWLPDMAGPGDPVAVGDRCDGWSASSCRRRCLARPRRQLRPLPHRLRPKPRNRLARASWRRWWPSCGGWHRF